MQIQQVKIHPAPHQPTFKVEFPEPFRHESKRKCDDKK